MNRPANASTRNGLTINATGLSYGDTSIAAGRNFGAHAPVESRFPQIHAPPSPAISSAKPDARIATGFGFTSGIMSVYSILPFFTRGYTAARMNGESTNADAMLLKMITLPSIANGRITSTLSAHPTRSAHSTLAARHAITYLMIATGDRLIGLCPRPISSHTLYGIQP